MLDDTGWAVSEIGGPVVRVNDTELILAGLALLGRHTACPTSEPTRRGARRRGSRRDTRRVWIEYGSRIPGRLARILGHAVVVALVVEVEADVWWTGDDAVWVKVAIEMGGEAVGAVAFVEESDEGAEDDETAIPPMVPPTMAPVWKEEEEAAEEVEGDARTVEVEGRLMDNCLSVATRAGCGHELVEGGTKIDDDELLFGMVLDVDGGNVDDNDVVAVVRGSVVIELSDVGWVLADDVVVREGVVTAVVVDCGGVLGAARVRTSDHR
ncbi:hypothetical protein ARMGADRAFT_1162433 [Armillaria gallica]|uniref:Uncharacterized protein n=1 Tax=Armillaria gallica TaxID=47427 RepID=A0A2H3DQU6_ARMGA|nr:hypothetical protein ARMGADRAFT_1162433 [Armillaria gallica]